MTRRPNPRGSKGKFARCVKAVSKRGGARDPKAVCGAMEKKYRGNPTNYRTRGKAFARTLMKRERKFEKAHRGEMEHGHLRRQFDDQINRVFRSKGKDAANEFQAGFLETYRQNPASQAISAYEEFHGRKPDEYITVKRQVHVHRHLAGAGQLRKMKVQSVDGKRMVTLSRFGDALLAFNEKKNQLFIEGGSQSVDVKAFGIRTQHEVETLGKVVMLDYFTRKDHLGEEGGTAIYRHKFRTVNQDGRPVTVKILRYPDLIYFTLDKHLVFSGGDYEILAEGIDK